MSAAQASRRLSTAPSARDTLSTWTCGSWTPTGAHPHDSDDVVMLLERDDGFVWVDVPVWDDEVDGFLPGPRAATRWSIEACRHRNHVPTVHSYADHYFVTVHSPLLGAAGHVHLLELDQIVGDHFLVTVHGPLNPVVDPAEALVETAGVLRRIEAGRFRPGDARPSCRTPSPRPSRAASGPWSATSRRSSPASSST